MEEIKNETLASTESEDKKPEVEHHNIIAEAAYSQSSDTDAATDNEVQLDLVEGTYNGKGRNTSSVPAYFQPVHPLDDSVTIDEQIDALAKETGKKFKKNSVLNGLCMGVILVVFAAVLLATFLTRGKAGLAWIQWTMLGIGLVFVIASFILSSLISKQRGKIAREYLQIYQDKINGYVAPELNLEDSQLALDAKFDDFDVFKAHYFKNVNNIESRCIVEAKRNGKEFRMGEVSVIVPARSVADANHKPTNLLSLDGTPYVPQVSSDTVTGTQEVASKDMTVLDLDLSDEANFQKENEKRNRDIEKANRQDGGKEIVSGLFGRLHVYDMKVSSHEALIIAYMGDKNNTCLPDSITLFPAVHIPGLRSNIVVYVTDPKTSAKFFDEEGVRRINSIETNNVLQSAFIAINSYGTRVGMTLSDDIMRLPNKSITCVGSYDTYRSAIVNAFSFIDYVDEKKDN